MKSKWNQKGRRYMAVFLAILMVWSLIPGNSFSIIASAANKVSGNEATPSDAEKVTEEEEKTDEVLDATPSNAARGEAFEQSQTTGGITIRVTADPGIFPADATLHVELVEDTQLQEQIQTAVEETTGAKDESKKTVEKTMAFDITILDGEGNEVQPDTEQGQVKVSFEKVDTTNVEAGKSTLEVFHLNEDNTQAEKLDAEVDVNGKTVKVQAGHFSLYVLQLYEAGLTAPELVGGVYQIGTADDLWAFAAIVNGTDGFTSNTSTNAVLTQDIDANNRAWTPIGNMSYTYQGTFDGQGHTIRGLEVNLSDTEFVGLFGYVRDSTIKNVNVVDFKFNGKETGGVCGVNGNRGTITNCTASGSLSGTLFVGGVSGRNSGSITNCTASGSIGISSSSFCCYGGVCASSSGSITNCYYDKVKCTFGGIAGEDKKGSAEGKSTEEFASGEVAYLLNGKISFPAAGETLAWYQNLDNGETADTYPVLDSTHGVVYLGDSGYTNNVAAISSYSEGYGTVIKSMTCGKTEADSLIWTAYDNDGDRLPEILVISGTGDMADYTSIGPVWYRIYRTYLTKLVLEEGITSIGNFAFAGCGFTGNLTIPSSVKSIGDSAFWNCSGLTGNLTIPAGVKSIGDRAFYDCSGFNGSLTIPNGVTSIGDSAFYNCSGFIGGLTIPNGVTTIEASAFNGCGFTGNLTIPEGVTAIGHYAFAGCGFTGNLTIPEGVTAIGHYAFAGCSGFTGDLKIPEGVTSIGIQVFAGCSGFTGDLKIPGNVTSIGNSAFYNCSGFNGLTIPEGVTSIGDNAFNRCSGFTGDLKIPDSVTSIGSSAFIYCKQLDNVIIEARTAKKISLGKSAFSGVTSSIISFVGDRNSEATLLKISVGGSELTANADGTFTISMDTVNNGTTIDVLYIPYVASATIDNVEKKFTDLQTAVNSITGNQIASIKLLSDVDLEDKSLNLTGSNNKITLDTNGFTLTSNNAVDGTIVIASSNTLNITGLGTVENTGTTKRALSIKAGSNVTIAERITVTGNILNYGTLSVKGTIDGTTENHSQIKNEIEAGSVTISYPETGSNTETVSEGGVTTIHAKAGDKVTFSATAQGNYTVSGLAVVKDANGKAVEVTKEAGSDVYGKQNNTVNYSFTMPETVATISIPLLLPEEATLVDGSYNITNGSQLLWFSNKVNAGETSINARLTKDIDMKDIFWTGITTYAGTFDGAGFTIKNLNAAIPEQGAKGFVDVLQGNGVIENLHFDTVNVFIQNVNRSAVIAGENNGMISGCTVENATVQCGDYNGLAGIVALNNSMGTVQNCAVLNSTLKRRHSGANAQTIGGIADGNKGRVQNCYTYKVVFTSASAAGGIVARGTAPTNSYFYTTSTTSSTVDGTAKTAEAFASGEVAYLLNGSTSTPAEGETLVWYQTLGTDGDAYPVLDGSHGMVYKLADGVYSNSNVVAAADKMIGHSLTPNGTISVNFYMEFTVETIQNKAQYYVQITNAAGTVHETMELSDMLTQTPKIITDTEGVHSCYKISGAVAAKKMADKLTVRLVKRNDGQQADVFTEDYAVADYFAQAKQSGDAELIALTNAMAIYGAYSQQYFQYNTGSLATDLSGVDVSGVTAETLTKYTYNLVQADNAPITYYGSSLLLEADTALRYYFKLSEGTESTAGLVFKIGDDIATLVQSTKDSSLYYIEIGNIRAQDLELPKTVTVGTTDTAYITLTNYSPLTYVKKALESTNTKAGLQTAMQALYLYWAEADTYNYPN